MTAARSSWKRLNTDLEDSDECLPISKRICSLHIESQAQEINLQNGHRACVGPLGEFSSDLAVLSSPININTGHCSFSVLSEPPSPRRLDLFSEFSSCTKIPFHNGEDKFIQNEVIQRHTSSGAESYASASSLSQHQKLDPVFAQVHASNQICMPNSSINGQQNQVHQNMALNEQSAVPSIESSTGPYQNIPEYSQDFHLQQLPSGIYDPELGMEENPIYFSVNQMLYEAHLYRVRRESNFSINS